MPGKLSSESIEIIKADYKVIGCYKLAEKLKINPKTVYRYAKKFNLPGPSVKFTAIYIEKECVICGKHFQKSKKIITKEHPAHTCSKQCSGAFKRLKDSKTKTVIELVEKGFKNREISEKTGIPMGSIASILNRAFFRRDEGKSFATTRNRFKKENNKCQICNFDRVIDVAHIIPASQNGGHNFDNLLALCPNHHHLFDTNKLTVEEFDKIKEKVLKKRSYNV